jgi:hypothetical protein
MVFRRKSKPPATDNTEAVPGVDSKAVGSLLVADIVMSAGTFLLGRFVDKRILKTHYDKDAAREMRKQRTKGQAIATSAATKLATRSVPGAAIVTGGLLVGSLYKRGRARKKARLQQAQLPHTTED